jgi:hypothetical protein
MPGAQCPHVETGFGASFAVLDDFYDGYARVLFVGAPNYYEPAETEPVEIPHATDSGRGAIFAFDTNTDTWEHLATLVAHVRSSNMQFGIDATAIGDFDDDDSMDLAVGSFSAGHVQVFYGGTAPEDPEDPEESVEPDLTLTGSSADDFGRRVFSGDLNADGLGDLIVGAPAAASNAGKVYVYFGRTTRWTGHVTSAETAADLTITGEAGSRIGWNLGAGTDVTGDGEPDLVLATGSSSPYVLIFEGPLSDANDPLDAGDAQGKLTGFANAVPIPDGEALSIAEDLTGNQVHDILVSDDSAIDGRVVLIEGGPHLVSDLPLSLAQLAGHRRFFHIPALQTTDGFASVVAAIPPRTSLAKDVPGQLAVAAPYLSGDVGMVYLYDLGSPGRLPSSGGGGLVFREKGEVAQSQGLDYVGTPTAGIAFDYDPATAEQRIFMSRSDASGVLYQTGPVSASSGIASFVDRTFTGASGDFLSNDDLPTANSLRGMAAADMDNDGDIDFIVCAPAGTSADDGTRLYRMEAGKFEDISDEITITGTSQSLKEAFQRCTAASWADYDLDGQIDLLLTLVDSSGDGLPPVLLRNRILAAGEFEDVSVVEEIEVTSDPGIRSWAHAWGDFDHDGDLDLFLGEDYTASSPTPRLYRNDAQTGGGFTPVSISSSPQSGVNSATWADVDEDGDLDIVLANYHPISSKLVIRNNGNGTFDGIAAGSQLELFSVLPIDFDYDGKLDFITASAESDRAVQALRVTKHPGTGSLAFTDYGVQNRLGSVLGGTFVLADDLGGLSSARDGDLDILSAQHIASSSTELPELLMQSVVLDPDATLEDIESTLDAEIDNHWIGIVLRGGGGNNAAAVGARVSLTHTDPLGIERTQVATVDGGSLRGGQRSQVLRFGLGAATSIDGVSIEWPDGSSQSPSLSGIDQVHEIEDSSDPTPTADAFTYEPAPNNTVNWIFEWDSVQAGRWQDTGVTVEWVSGGGSCYFATVFLQFDDPDVSYTMQPVFSAGAITKFHHKLIWNRACVPSCNYRFKAQTGTLFQDPNLSTSWTDAKIKLCAGS